MIEVRQKESVDPMCPHCSQPIREIWFRELRGTFGRRYVLDGEDVEGNLASTVRRRGSVLEVVDEPVGVSLALRTDVPAWIEADPVRTVSRSEAGFELIFQAARVRLAWDVDLAPGECWATHLDLTISVR